jgi:hypothetical protein
MSDFQIIEVLKDMRHVDICAEFLKQHHANGLYVNELRHALRMMLFEQWKYMSYILPRSIKYMRDACRHIEHLKFQERMHAGLTHDDMFDDGVHTGILLTYEEYKCLNVIYMDTVQIKKDNETNS